MFTMDNIVSSSADFRAQKILIYGSSGLGKTTFGTTFEAPFLLRVEDGASALDVPTFPKLIETYQELIEAINALHSDHQFKTLIVDSLDWLEPIVWTEILRKYPTTEKGQPVSSIEDYGYGKGYVKTDEVWRYIIQGLDSLRLNKGMNLVIIAHTEQKRVEPPDSDPYDRYQIKLQKRAWAIWQEWVDMLLFATYERTLIKIKDGGGGKANDTSKDKNRAEGKGNRVIYTEERPAYLAKNRWSLPDSIRIGQDKNWSGFHQALHDATKGKYQLPSQLQQQPAQSMPTVPAGQFPQQQTT